MRLVDKQSVFQLHDFHFLSLYLALQEVYSLALVINIIYHHADHQVLFGVSELLLRGSKLI